MLGKISFFRISSALLHLNNIAASQYYFITHFLLFFPKHRGKNAYLLFKKTSTLIHASFIMKGLVYDSSAPAHLGLYFDTHLRHITHFLMLHCLLWFGLACSLIWCLICVFSMSQTLCFLIEHTLTLFLSVLLFSSLLGLCHVSA